ncbi:hypothetical protein FJT64_012884 [Amphibalanus amphitrite]|uniref:Uncharacterized protein n=1 Tax=Amphibalanus amphitrite TaxID=1232801 RepID=A0A6A4UY52_AMPAM|nr:hypothetical protein FJT64_012884 [Amphibalanus amphitrite]
MQPSLRAVCGANVTPNAVEARARLRILLMAPSPLEAVSRRRPVEAEANSSFLSTGQQLEMEPHQPSYISSAAVEDLDIEVQEPGDAAAVQEREECLEVLETAMGPADAGPSIELGPQREGLAFVAGYVAAKCSHLNASLGSPTSSASPGDLSSLPNSWIATISRGQLYVPSAAWLAAVEDFELNFCLLMGASADEGPDIMKRLIHLIQLKQPGLDRRVARKLASTRLHLRLRYLNGKLDAARAERRAAQQVRQHARSSRL